MGLRQKLVDILNATEESRKVINKYKIEKDKLINPLLPRVEKYLKITQPEDFDFDNDEARNIFIYDYSLKEKEDKGAFVHIYNSYRGEWYDEEDVLIPWKFLDMSDEDFDIWFNEQEQIKRILEEAKERAYEEFDKESRRKQYEELKKEFES